MINVMVDLETMGTGPDAAIVAIGAVVFDPASHNIDGETFYRVVDLASSVRQGGVIDADTVMWWLQQGDQARSCLANENKVDIIEALMAFAAFLRHKSNGAGVMVWGNGAGFDNVILALAFKRAGLSVPWPFWADRCYRTVAALCPEIKRESYGVAHNALDDAVAQALHLMKVLFVLKDA